MDDSENSFIINDPGLTSQRPPIVAHFEDPESVVVWSSKDGSSLSSSGLPAVSAPIPVQQTMVNFDVLPDLDGFDAYSDLQDILGDDSLPRDVLDFGVDLAFDKPSIFHTEFELPPDQSLHQPENERTEEAISANRSGFVTPGLRENLNIKASVQAFKESLWLWTPEIDHAALEQRNLSLPWDNMSAGNEFHNDFPLLHQGVSNVTRGKTLAMVLGTCLGTSQKRRWSVLTVHPRWDHRDRGADRISSARLINATIKPHASEQWQQTATFSRAPDVRQRAGDPGLDTRPALHAPTATTL